MFAALSAAVLAFCAAAAPVSAQTSLELAPLEVRQDARAIPEYALGSDLSLYLPGDADLDGRTSIIEFPVEGGGRASAELKADAHDSSMVLRYFVCRNAGIDCTMEQIVNLEVVPPESK